MNKYKHINMELVFDDKKKKAIAYDIIVYYFAIDVCVYVIQIVTGRWVFFPILRFPPSK